MALITDAHIKIANVRRVVKLSFEKRYVDRHLTFLDDVKCVKYTTHVSSSVTKKIKKIITFFKLPLKKTKDWLLCTALTVSVPNVNKIFDNFKVLSQFHRRHFLAIEEIMTKSSNVSPRVFVRQFSAPNLQYLLSAALYFTQNWDFFLNSPAKVWHLWFPNRWWYTKHMREIPTSWQKWLSFKRNLKKTPCIFEDVPCYHRIEHYNK